MKTLFYKMRWTLIPTTLVCLRDPLGGEAGGQSARRNALRRVTRRSRSFVQRGSKKQFYAFWSQTRRERVFHLVTLVCATVKKNAADPDSQNAPAPFGIRRARLAGASPLTYIIIPSHKTVTDVHFPERVKTLLRSLVCDSERICVCVGLKNKKDSKSAVDLDSHDAPVLSVWASAHWADRLPVSRPSWSTHRPLGGGRRTKKKDRRLAEL